MVINDSNYEEVMAQGKPAVLDFSATWCGPCKMLATVLEKIDFINILKIMENYLDISLSSTHNNIIKILNRIII